MSRSYALLPYFGLVCFSLSFSVAEIRLFRSLFVEVAMINRVAFSLENLRGIVRVEMPKKRLNSVVTKSSVYVEYRTVRHRFFNPKLG